MQNIREDYAGTSDQFIAHVRTGNGDPAVLATFARELPAIASAELWAAITAMGRAPPSTTLYEIAIRIFHLPNFVKYIEYAFSRFVPCGQFIPEAAEALNRSEAAVALACIYQHLLPRSMAVQLDELRNLAVFYRHSEKYGAWSGRLRSIRGFSDIAIVPAPPAVAEPDPPEPSLWERFFIAAAIGLDYDVPSPAAETERRQIAKLARLARELILKYIPADLHTSETLQLLTYGLPPLMRTLCVKPARQLGETDKLAAVNVLGNLVDFFRLYERSKSISRDPAAAMFLQTPSYNLDAALLGAATRMLPDMDPGLRRALEQFIGERITQTIDLYLNAEHVTWLLGRLLASRIDFENFEQDFINPFSDDHDPDYSYRLGTSLSELINSIIRAGSGGGLASYIVTTMLSFSKTNGDALQRAHRDFLAGTCSMKPLIILHHLATGPREPPADLKRAALDRIREAAAGSRLAAIVAALSSGLLESIVDTLLEIARDTRLIHLFAFYMLRKN